jgi:hypothetical protein
MTNMTLSRDVSLKVCVWVLAVLAALSVIAYYRALGLPFISDDYLQIALARQWGPMSGWPQVAADPLYRCRETSLILTYWTERLFGLNVAAFNWSSVLLHVACTWMVFALGSWRLIGWRVAAIAAGFFAVYEGHQEAVMWYAAIPELLVFFFSLAGLLAWIAWAQSEWKGVWLPALTLGCYVLALFSKESGVALAGLVSVVTVVERGGRRAWMWWSVLVALAGVYFWSALAASSTHLHFNDGTFSLRAPFWKTMALSSGRLFWFWGMAAVIALCRWRAVSCWKLGAVAAAWIVITFLPYSFLTYMPRVPSRHTYFASAGLALLVGAWLWTWWQQRQWGGRWAVATVAVVMMAHNCGYIWTRKQRQFEERARPTAALTEYGRKFSGPVPVRCFPYAMVLAELTLEIELHKQMEVRSDHGFCPDDEKQSLRLAGELPPE